MNPNDIDDRGLTPQDPADPRSVQSPDAATCPECLGLGAMAAGEACPVCDGTGKANSRTGGG